jgi:hypothetical protein
MWMNDYDVETETARYAGHRLLGPATRTLTSLVEAVNGCSDGWAYWNAPQRAAGPLMDLIGIRRTLGRSAEREDVTPAALRKAYGQLRRFRTAHPQVKFTIFAAPGVPGDPEDPGQADVPVVQHQIRITVTGDRAVVTVAGDGPLAPGRYMGAVIRLADNRDRVA